MIKFRFCPSRKARPRRRPDTCSAARRSRGVAAGAALIPLRASPTGAATSTPTRAADPAAGRGRGARVPRALHPLRRVHEGVPEQRAAPGVLRGRARRRSGRRSSSRASATASPPASLCGQVCPTGAIQKITEKQKLGQRVRQEADSIGTAFYDQGRCLPWAMATAVHRLRGVLSDVARRRSTWATPTWLTPEGRTKTVAQAGRGSEAVHRLRRVREGLPGQGPPGGLRDERGGNAVEDEPVHSAGGPETVGRRPSAAGFRLPAVSGC